MDDTTIIAILNWIGTHIDIVLSIVSILVALIVGFFEWEQNKRMLLIEENNYLASNVGSALVSEISVKGIGSLACNFNLHDEQLVSTDKAKSVIDNLGYGSIKLLCKLQPMDMTRHIALVKLHSVSLIGSKVGELQVSYIKAYSVDSGYSKVAISKDFDRFEFTFIMTKDEKTDLIESINTMHSKLLIEIEMDLLTDKYVESTIKCRATMCNPDYDEKEKIYSHFKTTDEEPPMCFWNGASVKHKKDIIVKTISEDK